MPVAHLRRLYILSFYCEVSSYFTADKFALIPASEFIAHAFAYANVRRFFAPLNINSTHSHLLYEGVVIFFNIKNTPEFLITNM